ncbi:MAG: cytochrome B6, partial [Candidatus Marinimicrobia bacterium]|nr:cytochrome B6 [Candidatus Neomarinimicrobiota bacterium]
GVIVPGLILLGLIIWPFLDKSGSEAVGVWFAKTRQKHNIIFLVMVLLIIILTVIGTFLRGPNWNFYWPWEAWPEMPTKI